MSFSGYIQYPWEYRANLAWQVVYTFEALQALNVMFIVLQGDFCLKVCLTMRTTSSR